MAYMRVHVVPESRNECVIEEGKDLLVVHVREEAKAGRANKRMLELLRTKFGGSIRLVSGHHAPHKIVSID